MRNVTRWADVVVQQMGDIAERHSLVVRQISDDETLLEGETYALVVGLDRREGPYVVYFDKAQPALPGYNVYLYLANHRREALTTPPPFEGDDRFVMELAALAHHLGSAGENILAGDKAWLRAYHWPAVDGARMKAFINRRD